MGNCQAAEAATAVVHHTDGKVERLYWPTAAGEVMRAHPGHYVALATTVSLPSTSSSSSSGAAVRITKLRLLRQKETLALGHVYRLVTSQEVVKALKARKQERMKKQLQQQNQNQNQKQVSVKSTAEEEHVIDSGKDQRTDQEAEKGEKNQNFRGKGRQWKPSLQSISEAAS